MNLASQCVLALHLAENADELTDIQGYLQLLQECFVRVFKGDEALAASPASRNSPSPRDIASREEEKLTLARAVERMHQKGRGKHGTFFQSEGYYVHAALFIHELLNSLSGNSKNWFRELQVLSLQACHSILEVLSTSSIRNCVPGVTSATIRYIKRSHHGKDSTQVRLYAIDLLHQCLKRAFSASQDSAWIRTSAQHLSRALAVIDPSTIVSSHYDPTSLLKWESLTITLLRAPALVPEKDACLFRLLAGSFLVLNNMCHLHRIGIVEEVNDEGEELNRENTSSQLSASQLLRDLFDSELMTQFVRETLQELRGVPLLHASTTVFRVHFLRHILLNCRRDDSKNTLFHSILQKCVRLVGAELSTEDLYTHRYPRRYPTGAVDEFLETAAHALAETPHVDAEISFHSTNGERLTNDLMEDAQQVLQDWDMFMMHPATVYVVSRIIVWQFKPVPVYLQQWFSSDVGTFPLPVDFTECAVLEQLWSIIGQSHLWNILEDEELCSAQQIFHRRVMAAIILRVLSLVADDVIKHASEGNVDEKRNAFERLCVLTLYPIMEKAAIPGFVHDAAMQCLESYVSSSGETAPLGFFSRISDYIVDEASRAVKEEFLRTTVTGVLRGAINFLVFHATSATPSDGGVDGVNEQGLDGSAESIRDTTQRDAAESEEAPNLFRSSSLYSLPQLIRLRMSTTAVRFALSRTRMDTYCITKSAEFITVVVQIASSAVQPALQECDESGARALFGLLRDSLDVVSLLIFLFPVEQFHADEERQTTSANPAVKQLQIAVLECIHVLQTHALYGHAAVGIAVEALLRGLTCFLTSSGALPQEEREVTTVLGNEEEEAHQLGIFSRNPPKIVDWFHSSHQIILPRTLLTVVYQTYMPLLSLLKEPIRDFITGRSSPGHRSQVELRQLQEVGITATFSAALLGLHALLLLAFDFLQHRYVTEVFLVVLVWYERVLLPPILTPTESKAKQRIKDFLNVLRRNCSNGADIDASCMAVEQNIRDQQLKRQARADNHSSKQRSTASTLSTTDIFLTREDLYIGTEKTPKEM